MILEFVQRFEERKELLQEKLKEKHPQDYKHLVKLLIEQFDGVPNQYDYPDPERIHEIDDGDYQGTLVYLIAENGYQPSTYWYVKVGYGSCSGCDSLEGIRQYHDDPPNDEQVKDYMTLLLHIVQGLKKMGDEV